MKEGFVLFGDDKVRRVWDDGRWFFSIVDVIGVLTGSLNARRYWSDMKIKLKLEGSQLYDFIVRLKMKSSDGKEYLTDCADLKGVFRIIQSIPSRRVEPFKLWLAKIGEERIGEIRNPERAQERMKKLYEKKGYSKDWVDKRIRGIAIRQNLTDEWKDRGVGERVEYAILTDEISKATFGRTISEYKRLKGLGGENLRDHMDELELIFGMLGEKVATEVTVGRDAEGFGECKDAAREGGEVAGNARRDAESRIGRSVVSEENFLDKGVVKDKKEVLNVD